MNEINEKPVSPLKPFLDTEERRSSSGKSLLDRPRRARFEVARAKPSPLPQVDRLLGGAAEVDITPPPGMPKAGYSSNAHDGNGFRSRLRARVLHLRGGTTSMAIVQCDLLGGSSVLQHLVAERVSATTDLSVSGLMIGATHTHAGPGQFLGTDFYNKFASNRGGFDPTWTEFLVEQISKAVVEAVEQRTEVKVAVGSAEVWGFTRNRSLEPHVRNDSVRDKRLEPQRKWASVNPTMRMVRMDTVDGEPLGALSIFSVHGTGVSQHSHEYNADLWAYLVGKLRSEIRSETGAAPIVGAIEGTHADIAPALRPDQAGHIEAARVGEGIGAEAFELWRSLQSQLSAEIDLGVGFREIDLNESLTIDGVELPNRPAVGAALVAGARENLTPVIGRIPPFRAGSPKPWKSGPHGPKWILGSARLQPLLLPLQQFPRIIPTQAFRIGTQLLIALPFEVTLEAGRQISHEIAEALATSRDQESTVVEKIDDIAISSVANEYCGYAATAREYELQFYEGGHTLYGANTVAFLAKHSAQVAKSVAGGSQVDEGKAVRKWDLAYSDYLARPTGVNAERKALSSPIFHDPTAAKDGHWEFSWQDVAPGDMNWHEQLVAIESADIEDSESWKPAMAAQLPVNDQQTSIQIIWDGEISSSGTHKYRVRWFDPDHDAAKQHRFVLGRGDGGEPFHSPPFS